MNIFFVRLPFNGRNDFPAVFAFITLRPRVEAGKATLPGHKTPLKNFYLTGDYTFPGIGT
jgi:phytoene dehydrogenase-like protein